MNVNPSLFMDIRSEYTRLRKNIMQRAKRIEARTGLPTYKVNLPQASKLSDKQIVKAYERAKAINPNITTQATIARHERKLAKQRERQKKYREVQKVYKEDPKKAGFLKGARKWLKRHGYDENIINQKNLDDWIEYYDYRKSISSEKKKYEFEKFITEMAEQLEEDEEGKKATVSEVLEDYKAYMKEQAEFIEQAKKAFGETVEEYSAETVSNKYFKKR
jgi:hypothetical protein